MSKRTRTYMAVARVGHPSTLAWIIVIARQPEPYHPMSARPARLRTSCACSLAKQQPNFCVTGSAMINLSKDDREA